MRTTSGRWLAACSSAPAMSWASPTLEVTVGRRGRRGRRRGRAGGHRPATRWSRDLLGEGKAGAHRDPPRPGRLSSRNSPPSSSARCRMDTMPVPNSRSSADSRMPRPLSRTSSSSGCSRPRVSPRSCVVGMPHRVGEHLGRDAVSRYLHGGTYVGQVIGMNVTSRTSASRGQRPSGSPVPDQIIERRGAEAFAHVAHLGDGLRDTRATSIEKGLSRWVVHERPRRLHLKPNAGEGRAETVVQLAPQPASFLLGIDQLLPAALQVLLQAERRSAGPPARRPPPGSFRPWDAASPPRAREHPESTHERAAVPKLERRTSPGTSTPAPARRCWPSPVSSHFRLGSRKESTTASATASGTRSTSSPAAAVEISGDAGQHGVRVGQVSVEDRSVPRSTARQSSVPTRTAAPSTNRRTEKEQFGQDSGHDAELLQIPRRQARRRLGPRRRSARGVRP